MPATLDLLRAARRGSADLACALSAQVTPAWPPEYLDDAALAWTEEKVAAGISDPHWWMYFAVLRAGDARVLIGSCGYKGPPEAHAVELGYGVVAEYRRRGLASEMTEALVAQAFAVAQVRTVLAETLAGGAASQAVLRRCGFALQGPGSEPGVLRFARARPAS